MAKRKSTTRARGSARKKAKAKRTKKAPARRRLRPAVRRAARKTPKPRSARSRKRRAPTAKKTSNKRAPSKRPAVGRAPVRTRPKPAALERERRQLPGDEAEAGSPSTLGYLPKASSAGSGHEHYRQRLRTHGAEDRSLTSGDLDADWNEAYSSGEETPGGDMQTPDQDIVDEIGLALGVEYDDAEELKGSEKIERRDKHRWEYNPASAEDYTDRDDKE